MKRRSEPIVKQVPVDQLHIAPWVDSKMPLCSWMHFTLLCQSIHSNGMLNPIVATPRGTIIDGINRWLCARLLKLPTVPVLYRDITEEDVLVVWLNRSKVTA